MRDFVRICHQHAALTAALDRLEGLDALPEIASRLRAFQQEVVADGMDGCAATGFMSASNDTLVRRIILLVARRHRLPSVDWCWLALGSEGRHEQTFVTDQDNALIFHASSAQEANALRDHFQTFAQEANQRLADAGFKLCSGQIMAGNPAWCLSFDEWRDLFIDWVRRPDPSALLNASIFFDLRPLQGDSELAEQLRTLFLSMTSDTPAMLHLMAANALQAEAPLSFRGEPVVDTDEAIDLKKFGSRIFVDAARIFALAHNVRAVNTRERLLQSGRAAGLQPGEIAAVNAAFGHILRLRLAQQMLSAQRGETAGYGLKPAALHEMDRAILREALKQAKRLQQRLKLNYAL